MDLNEKVNEKKTIYEGKKVSLDIENVVLPNGKNIDKEIVRRKGNAVILALTDQKEVVMEEQFRHPFESVIHALPAGKADEGETPLETAKRELQEETGYTAEKWTSLGSFYPAPAYSDEVVYLYLAQGLHLGEKKWDPDEFLNIYTLPLETFYKQCEDGTIKDGRTLLAAYKAKEYLLK